MLTHRRHRYLTRWNRCAALAVVLALLAWQCYRVYRAWQAHQPQPPQVLGPLAGRFRGTQKLTEV